MQILISSNGLGELVWHRTDRIGQATAEAKRWLSRSDVESTEWCVVLDVATGATLRRYVRICGRVERMQ